jgi:hypothetical protein
MNAKTGYRRDISLFERVALVAAEASPPGANQLILEGTGSFDAGMWRGAVEAASQDNPGSRLVRQGSRMGLKWVDSGIPPPVRQVEGGGWNGYDLGNAPFLLQRLNPDCGPTCEVLLIRGEPLRVAFRTLHAVMDLVGTMVWADDIFRVLRGEPTIGSGSTLTDLQLLKSLQGPKPRVAVGHEPGRRFRAPTGMPSDDLPGFAFRRLRIETNGSNFLARLLLLIARNGQMQQSGDARFAVSVDLRRRMPGLKSTANLVRDIFVDVDSHTTAQGITDSIRAQLNAFQDSVYWPVEMPLQHSPPALLRAFAKLSKFRRRKGEYRVTGLAANMGRISLERFRGGGFNPQGVFAIPPGHPAYPLFLAAFGYDKFLDIGFTVPNGLATGGRLELLLEAVKTGLQEN